MSARALTASDALVRLENLVSENPGFLFNMRNANKTVSGSEMLNDIRNAVKRGVPLAYFLGRIDCVTNDEVINLGAFLSQKVAVKVSFLYLCLRTINKVIHKLCTGKLIKRLGLLNLRLLLSLKSKSLRSLYPE